MSESRERSVRHEPRRDPRPSARLDPNPSRPGALGNADDAEAETGAERAFEALVSGVRPASAARSGEVRQRLDALTKPPGSLGRLEDLATRLSLIYGCPPPPLRDRTVFVLAGDHGVTARGVSAYPAEVTAQMCRNFAAGGAAINAIAGSVGAQVLVADLGVRSPLTDVPGVLDRKVRPGTRDLAAGPALARDEAIAAILAGARLVDDRLDLDLVGLGEMGIGNSTAAAAVTAALTGRAIADVVGPGTGVTDERLDRKRRVVERAIGRVGDDADGLEILRQVGGLELAGLVGVTLATARARRGVIADGFIATAAAALAVRLCPPARDYLFAAHRSPEPGHAALLSWLDLAPLFDFRMRLGEGTAAALAMPLLDAAGSILREMATFDSAGISGPGATRRPDGRVVPDGRGDPGDVGAAR